MSPSPPTCSRRLLRNAFECRKSWVSKSQVWDGPATSLCGSACSRNIELLDNYATNHSLVGILRALSSLLPSCFAHASGVTYLQRKLRTRCEAMSLFTTFSSTSPLCILYLVEASARRSGVRTYGCAFVLPNGEGIQNLARCKWHTSNTTKQRCKG